MRYRRALTSVVISSRRGCNPAGLRGEGARYAVQPGALTPQAGSRPERREEITTRQPSLISEAVSGSGGARHPGFSI